MSIVMEFCDEGDLMKYIKGVKKEGRQLEEDEIMMKFVQVSLELVW